MFSSPNQALGHPFPSCTLTPHGLPSHLHVDIVSTHHSTLFHSVQTLLMHLPNARIESFSPCLCHLELNPTSLIPEICSQKENQLHCPLQKALNSHLFWLDSGHLLHLTEFYHNITLKKGPQKRQKRAPQRLQPPTATLGIIQWPTSPTTQHSEPQTPSPMHPIHCPSCSSHSSHVQLLSSL